MGITKIEWTSTQNPDGSLTPGFSFNPWIGCSKVSPGCRSCYAENLMDVRYKKVIWGVNGTRVRTSAAYWDQPAKWNREAEKQGKRKKVFCASLADVFEEYHPNGTEIYDCTLDQWREDLFDVIESTPYLDWLLLTKRPQNIKRMIPQSWDKIPDNVWMGTSVENQEQADIRIPELLSVPAIVRFLSMEPLLGPVNLLRDMRPYSKGNITASPLVWMAGINWIICGGESGANARPIHPNWVRSIQQQCRIAGVPFFFKQWGEYLPVTVNPIAMFDHGAMPKDWPWEQSDRRRVALDLKTDLLKVGKHAAGLLLDGETYHEFPLTHLYLLQTLSQ